MSTTAGRLLRTRWLMRAPIGLYRAGLGFLLGRRMLMLEHRGRKSGLPRQVVLETVDRPGPQRFVVVSGFGAASQWYRNVLADPRVKVSVGTRRDVPAVARAMTAEESAATLSGYQRRHPIAWRFLAPAMRDTLGEDLALPMVELTLAGGDQSNANGG
ncbi:nitroreductase family deazaflavin-dependent oxidoreductase [[Mycobacterium] burgundiense]|uniref:Nitroreductase family deazaflavin-dependent oxidoreductase n=1 Tax=[Mycobacterium] burgundiense TaxID=3064286 RepID=A0ABM9LD50_9MYCO|nr:nitroreductase family deazaflavin-dependent oxidoreductase [Mycolicibacterium sp. MU0053]CAJ1497012.1 nitroreductase family deazaflavin-dependent oxidoreductase [Mycolicibacterium sp. MU0053]